MKLPLAKACAAVLVAGATLVVPVGAQAAQASMTSFVVNTQFWADPSPMVSATGPLAGCTSAVELEGSTGELVASHIVEFRGTKLLECEDGSVTIGYAARLNEVAGRKTQGTWWVIDSTLPGVVSGGGRIRGDAARCQVLEGSEGCILDTFMGRVAG